MKEIMRIISIILSLVCFPVFFVGCTSWNGLQAAARPASAKAIIASMGQGLLGNSFDAMTPDERRRALEAEYKALEYSKVGESVDWHSKKGMAYGNVTAGQPYRVGSQNCRQYSHDFIVNDSPSSVRGSACRNPDGSWVPLI